MINKIPFRAHLISIRSSLIPIQTQLIKYLFKYTLNTHTNIHNIIFIQANLISKLNHNNKTNKKHLSTPDITIHEKIIKKN